MNLYIGCWCLLQNCRKWINYYITTKHKFNFETTIRISDLKEYQMLRRKIYYSVHRKWVTTFVTVNITTKTTTITNPHPVKVIDQI